MEKRNHILERRVSEWDAIIGYGGMRSREGTAYGWVKERGLY